MKTIKELDEISIAFEKDYWVAPKTRKSKTRHILLHMTKMLGKLGGVIEKWEHGLEADEKLIAQEVIPDMFMYALMLAREEGTDIEEAFLNRLEMNKKKVDSWRDKREIKELPQL